MFNKLWLIFILTTFMTGVLGESMTSSMEHDVELNSSVNVERVDYVSISSIDTDCDDCEDQDCHEGSDHCIHHCSGLHNLIVTTENVVLKSSLRIESKISRSYSFNYQEPCLDPALKPPLHS